MEKRNLKSMVHDEANELWSFLELNPEYEKKFQNDGMPEETTLKFLQEYFFREPQYGGHHEVFDFKQSVKLIKWLSSKGFDLDSTDDDLTVRQS